MRKQAGVKPQFWQALSLWAGSDHYSFFEALTLREFRLPLARINRVYRIDFGTVPGIGLVCRYLISYRSESRECIVVLDKLPEELSSHSLQSLKPFAAARIFLYLMFREPSAILSLLVIFAPMVLGFILFLVWNSFVLKNHELMAVMANQNCDAACVEKVLKIHSMVGVIFMTPLIMVFLPIGLMVFKAPRYEIALNYRLAQSFCVASLAVGVIFLAQQLAEFPFKNYSRFVMSGFGPEAVTFLKVRGLNKH